MMQVMMSIEDAVKKRYLSIHGERSRAILTVQHELISALRQFLISKGFYELLAPVIGPTTDPGIRGAGIVDFDFYGKSYKIMSSMILYKQMALRVFDKIFSVSPNVRLEDPESVKTGRHLAEFYQLDLEAAQKTSEDMMEIGDRLVCHCLQVVKQQCSEELQILNRDLPLFTPPFERIPHDVLAKKFSITGEVPWEEEKDLSEESEKPFWIVDYPVGSRGFYYLEKDGILKSMDLIMPEGYGEVVSGGEREFEYQRVKKLLERDQGIEEYKWYLDMLKAGIPPSAGFGLGIERLTRYVCGLDHIWEGSPFPKVPGIS
jgi:asparaginyl-tRNA synthetase